MGGGTCNNIPYKEIANNHSFFSLYGNQSGQGCVVVVVVTVDGGTCIAGL